MGRRLVRGEGAREGGRQATAMKRRQIRASLGEATELHAFPPAVEATNSALALERLHTTLRRLFWESFGEASEFPVLRILPKFLKSFGRKQCFFSFSLNKPRN